MSQISYKFKGDASHSSLKFEGSAISVGQIKQYIKQKHNLNQADRRAAQELQVFNAETGHGNYSPSAKDVPIHNLLCTQK